MLYWVAGKFEAYHHGCVSAGLVQLTGTWLDVLYWVTGKFSAYHCAGLLADLVQLAGLPDVLCGVTGKFPSTGGAFTNTAGRCGFGINQILTKS